MNSNIRSRKHSLKDGRSVKQWIPESKRPRVGASPISQPKNSVFETSSVDDPFGDDDDFTCAELEELEIVASQVDRVALKQGGFKTPSFSRKLPTSSCQQNHNNKCENLSQMEFQNKIQQLQQENDQKTGETCLLRDKLEGLERTLKEERQIKVVAAQNQKNELKSREAEFQKKLESYRDRFEFQSAELKEARGAILNLKQKNQSIVTNQMATGHVKTTPLSKKNKVNVVSPKPKARSVKNFSNFNDESATFDNNPTLTNQTRNKKIFSRQHTCILKSTYSKRRRNCELQKSVVDFHLRIQQLGATQIGISDNCYVDTVDLLRTIMHNEDPQTSCGSRCQLLKCIGNVFSNGCLLVETSLQLLQHLIRHLPQFEACFRLNTSIFSSILPLLSTHTKPSLIFLCELAKKFESEHLDRFLVFVPHFCNLVVDNLHLNELVELLLVLSSDPTIAELLVSNNVLSDLCGPCFSEEQADLLSKLLRLFTNVVCSHAGKLNEATTQNIHYFCISALFHQLKLPQHCRRRDSIVRKAISLLYCLPDVYTLNHRQIVVLWQMKDYLACSDGLWSEEMMSVVDNEIAALVDGKLK